MDMPSSEARKRANKKWNDKNRDKVRIMNYRSKAKVYISEIADKEELVELEKMIKDRLAELDLKE